MNYRSVSELHVTVVVRVHFTGDGAAHCKGEYRSKAARHERTRLRRIVPSSHDGRGARVVQRILVCADLSNDLHFWRFALLNFGFVAVAVLCTAVGTEQVIYWMVHAKGRSVCILAILLCDYSLLFSFRVVCSDGCERGCRRNTFELKYYRRRLISLNCTNKIAVGVNCFKVH